MPFTSNGFFYKPGDGERDYKQNFDQAVDKADSQIQENKDNINSHSHPLANLDNVTEGPLSNRPDPNESGRWYFTTDSNGIFYDTGTSWLNVTSISSVDGLSGNLQDAQEPTEHDNSKHSTNYASENHGHSISDVNSLQDELDSKVGNDHAHQLSDISATGNSGDVVQLDSSNNLVLDTYETNPNVFLYSESGTVPSGNAGIVITLPLEVSETVSVQTASLGIINTNGLPDTPPTGLDLSILVNDGGSGVSGGKIVQGDGTVNSAKSSGSPVQSYTNNTSNALMISIVVDNGGFDSNSGTGSDQEISTTGKILIN